MKRRPSFFLSTVITAVLALLALAFWLREKEPSYHGKYLNEWLTIYRERNSGAYEAGQGDEALRAIKSMGTNALPSVITWLDWEKGASNRLIVLMNKLPSRIRNNGLAERIADAPNDRFDNAVVCLEILGSNAAPVIPDLLRLMNRPGLTRPDNIAFAIGRIGPAGISALNQEILNPASLNRDTALRGIAAMDNLGTNALPAIYYLIDRLGDTNQTPFIFFLTALTGSSFDPDLVVPELACVAADPESSCARRIAALRCLTSFGSRAEAAIAVLVTATQNANEAIRIEATNALRILDPENPFAK